MVTRGRIRVSQEAEGRAGGAEYGQEWWFLWSAGVGIVTLNDSGRLWNPQAILVVQYLNLGDSGGITVIGLGCQNWIRKVAGGMGSGLDGVHMKGLTICRNWLTLGWAVPPGSSKTTRCQSIKYRNQKTRSLQTGE